jgi:hypothetical protein
MAQDGLAPADLGQLGEEDEDAGGEDGEDAQAGAQGEFGHRILRMRCEWVGSQRKGWLDARGHERAGDVWACSWEESKKVLAHVSFFGSSERNRPDCKAAQQGLGRGTPSSSPVVQLVACRVLLAS